MEIFSQDFRLKIKMSRHFVVLTVELLAVVSWGWKSFFNEISKEVFIQKKLTRKILNGFPDGKKYLNLIEFPFLIRIWWTLLHLWTLCLKIVVRKVWKVFDISFPQEIKLSYVVGYSISDMLSKEIFSKIFIHFENWVSTNFLLYPRPQNIHMKEAKMN